MRSCRVRKLRIKKVGQLETESSIHTMNGRHVSRTVFIWPERSIFSEEQVQRYKWREKLIGRLVCFIDVPGRQLVPLGTVKGTRLRARTQEIISYGHKFDKHTAPSELCGM